MEMHMDHYSPAWIITSIFIGISVLIFVVVNIVAVWKIFEKAGKPGWKSIIPVYNLIVIFDILGKPWWWILFLLIPGLHIIIPIWMIILLGERFGKSDLFIIGLQLFGFIMIPILAFSDAEYVKPELVNG
jgi:hypothetical protein